VFSKRAHSVYIRICCDVTVVHLKCMRAVPPHLPLRTRIHDALHTETHTQADRMPKVFMSFIQHPLHLSVDMEGWVQCAPMGRDPACGRGATWRKEQTRRRLRRLLQLSFPTWWFDGD
jgi:hypothetical protein